MGGDDDGSNNCYSTTNCVGSVGNWGEVIKEMVEMNFSGRWMTRNGTVVAVHKESKMEGVESVGYEWRGHELRLEPPYSDDKLIYWDEKGNCVKVRRGESELVERVNEGFDLVSVVNPQSYASSVECVDCQECLRWQKEH